jgi:hypothetical protein
MPGGQCAVMIRAEDPQPSGEHLPVLLLGLGVLAAKQVRGRNLEAEGQDCPVIGAQSGRILTYRFLAASK